jgi:prefoldin subunit 2
MSVAVATTKTDQSSSSAVATTAAPKLTTEKEILDAYNAKRAAQQGLMQRIAELEGEIHEHTLVLDQLKELDDGRRAHRLIGGALLEKTVGTVRPEIQENLNKFGAMIKMLQEQLVRKEKEMEDFMTENNITRGGSSSGNDLTKGQKQADEEADTQRGGVLSKID